MCVCVHEVVVVCARASETNGKWIQQRPCDMAAAEKQMHSMEWQSAKAKANKQINNWGSVICPTSWGKSESKVIGPRFKFTPRFHRPHTSGNLPKVRYRQFKGGRWWQTYKDIRVASFIHNILLELFHSTSLVSIGIKWGMTGKPQKSILGILQ